jgi:uncharacterized protein (DUF2062 family)
MGKYVQDEAIQHVSSHNLAHGLLLPVTNLQEKFIPTQPENFVSRHNGCESRFSPMTRASIMQKLHPWLLQGISPRRLALTLALGGAVGCIPLVGLPTVLCAGLALALGLNQPAIQAANYAAMPAQLLLVVPFVRLGGVLFSRSHHATASASALLHGSPFTIATQMGGIALQALLAWLVFAIPAVILLTLCLTPMLRRIPVVAAQESAS